MNSPIQNASQWQRANVWIKFENESAECIPRYFTNLFFLSRTNVRTKIERVSDLYVEIFHQLVIDFVHLSFLLSRKIYHITSRDRSMNSPIQKVSQWPRANIRTKIERVSGLITDISPTCYWFCSFVFLAI